jgi:hypothetical protein
LINPLRSQVPLKRTINPKIVMRQQVDRTPLRKTRNRPQLRLH